MSVWTDQWKIPCTVAKANRAKGPASNIKQKHSINTWAIDTFPKALALSLLGFVLVLVEIFIANAIVSVLRRFASVRIGKFQLGQGGLVKTA